MSDAKEDLFPIDPGSARRVLSRGRWLILAAAVAGIFLGHQFVSQEVGSPTTYSSSTDFRIIPVRAELEFARDALGGSSTQQTRALVRTVKESITSDEVLRAAIAALPEEPTRADLGLRDSCSGSDLINGFCNVLGVGSSASAAEQPASDISLQAYRSAIRIDQIEGSFVLRITVAMTNPQLAAEFANALVAAYNSAAQQSDDAAYGRISEAYGQQLADLKAEYTFLLDREIELRGDIEALTLESEIQRLQREIEAQSEALSEDEIALVATQQNLAALEAATAEVASPRTEEGASNASASTQATPPAPISLGAIRLPTQPELLRAEIDQLAAQIEERRLIVDGLDRELAEASRKQILLRPIIADQAMVLESIDELNSARLEIARSNLANAARIEVLRSGLPATRADPPSPIQGAVIGGSAGLILMASIVLAISMISAPPTRVSRAGMAPEKDGNSAGETPSAPVKDLSEIRGAGQPSHAQANGRVGKKSSPHSKNQAQ